MPEWLRYKVYAAAKEERSNPKWKVFLISMRDKVRFTDGFVTGALFAYNETMKRKRPAPPPREEE